MSGRSFFLLLVLIGSSQGFDPSMPSDFTPVTDYNYADNKGFIVTVSMSGGCIVALILYFVAHCLRKKKSSTPQDETADIEMCLNRDGSSVAPRLASAVAVSLATRANSVHAKASISSRNSAAYV